VLWNAVSNDLFELIPTADLNALDIYRASLDINRT